MKHHLWFCFAILLFSNSIWAKYDINISKLTEFKKWEPHQIQEVQLKIQLGANFHAYLDQFKILNLEPEGFKAGEIHIKPEIEFFDKYSKKNRKGFKEYGIISILIEAGDIIPADLKEIMFDLRHQICSESVCYLPKEIPVAVSVSQLDTTLKVEKPLAALEGPSLSEKFQNSLQTNLFLAFVLVFFAGVLTSFTPCIFPMLPITISILGYHANKGNRFHNFSRALSYVLGIAITYSLLGVMAALTGSLFGSALTNKYVIGALCLLFVVMALSMWDFFEIQVPAFLRNRLGTGKSHGLSGAFVMGLVAGIVASPCVGPVLVSILSFVSTTRNAFLGFGLLFTFAMGLGLIFIIIGLFSHALHFLPKSGPWMNLIKFILGACMWGAALYYAQFLMMHRWWLAVVALSFLCLAIWKGAFHFHKKNYLRQSFLLALFIFSSTVLLLSFLRPEYLTPAFNHTENEVTQSEKLAWVPYSDEALAQAQAENKPVLLDFFAEWCGACHELEEKTYTHPEFIELSKQFKLIKFDATEDTPEIQKIIKKYGVQGLPTVLFINKKGDLLKELTFTQFIEWNELKPKMQESLK
jgi:thioredoxin:protein disulfide reductase